MQISRLRTNQPHLFWWGGFVRDSGNLYAKFVYSKQDCPNQILKRGRSGVRLQRRAFVHLAMSQRSEVGYAGDHTYPDPWTKSCELSHWCHLPWACPRIMAGEAQALVLVSKFGKKLKVGQTSPSLAAVCRRNRAVDLRPTLTFATGYLYMR